MDHIRSRSKESAAKALAYFEEAWTLTPEARRAALRPYGQHLWHVMMGLAYAAGEIDKAKVYGSRLLGVLNEKDESWNYGNALHETQIVLGRIALQQGELERAKKYLLAAAVNPGSPQLNSFGPSMSLARELLKKGERETVLQYLEQVRRFWNNPDAIERLESWTKIIKDDKIPEDEDFLRR